MRLPRFANVGKKGEKLVDDARQISFHRTGTDVMRHVNNEERKSFGSWFNGEIVKANKS